jgi:hypothetical protein
MAVASTADLEGVISTVHPVMAALGQGVPLTLLMDLADPSGPDSRTVLATEVADLGWLRDFAFPASADTRTGSGGVSDRAAG